MLAPGEACLGAPGRCPMAAELLAPPTGPARLAPTLALASPPKARGRGPRGAAARRARLGGGARSAAAGGGARRAAPAGAARRRRRAAAGAAARDRDRRRAFCPSHINVSSIQFGGRARNYDWPPKKTTFNQAEQDDDGKTTLVPEGRTNERMSKEITTVDRWPFYEVALSNVPEVDQDLLKQYRILDLSDNCLRAFMMSNRWELVNAGRSAGFDRKGIAAISSAKVAVPALNRILNGLGIWQNWLTAAAGREVTREFFEQFAAEKGADEDSAAEMRAILFGEDAAEAAVRVTALIGNQKGAGLAVWALEPGSRSARLDLCLGEDCLAEGPDVEVALLRVVASEARKQGADQLLRGRARGGEAVPSGVLQEVGTDRGACCHERMEDRPGGRRRGDRLERLQGARRFRRRGEVDEAQPLA
ncbi:unnamed protein product [Prorocentrum cordatum]|uniref:Uncharacterized protein n=1 Tax=Prorocentrum cordatum TaxID=2364126 RepID=A0ABN9Y719_9DINO|nr:unnamed protein product [Polarella glacialis]